MGVRRITGSPRSREFWAGVRAELPLLLGVIPFGMIYGVLALEAGIPPGAAQAISAIIFAGSAQFITTQLVHLAAAPVVIVLTVAVVNLRHALYSASVSPYVKHLCIPWKLLLGYLLTDEAYAVTISHYQQSEGGPAGSADGLSGERTNLPRHWFFLGAGLSLWASWQASTAIGIFLGAVVPASWSLDFTLALTFIALVVPNLKDWSGAAAAISAGLAAVIAFSLPYKLGLIGAALIGVVIGLIVEQFEQYRMSNIADHGN